MQNEYQLCPRVGHEGCKLTHICIFGACKEISRYMCNKCIKEYTHRHYHHIEIEKFSQHFKNMMLPQIEIRLKSQNGNHAKLQYLTQQYENYFGDLGWFSDKLKDQQEILERIKLIIQDLINDYKNETVQVQLFNGIYQQLIHNGLQSLNNEQLNILLDNQFKFITKEIEYYDQLNRELNQFDKYNQLGEEQQSENQQKIRKIQKELRRINDYLDIQQYSTDGQEFIFESSNFYSKSFSSKNERYLAMYNKYPNDTSSSNHLLIRKQNTLDVNRIHNIKKYFTNIQFDPLFNYCIIQPEELLYVYFYTLRNTKTFKLIRKFSIQKEVREFYVSNNNIILVLYDAIFIKVLNIKNELINEIELEFIEDVCLKYSERQYVFSKLHFCYGSERNIFAIDDSQIKIYSETQKQPLLSLKKEESISFMKFQNNDSQLMTMDYRYCRLWQIDYCNLKITQVNKIESISYFIDINELNFTQSDGGGGIQILGNNHQLWFGFKTIEFQQNIDIKLKKHLIIIGSHSTIQVIKRRSITDYGRLECDY